MKDNEVWVLVELPPNGKTVGSKWLFKKKIDMDGNVHIYKAHIVVKGDNDIPILSLYLYSTEEASRTSLVLLLIGWNYVGGYLGAHGGVGKDLVQLRCTGYAGDDGGIVGDIGRKFRYGTVWGRDPTPSNRPTKVEVPKELSKVSMVNTSLKNLNTILLVLTWLSKKEPRPQLSLRARGGLNIQKIVLGMK
uniref:Putative retrotransposon protein n=1 Tax=Tanacetum cinerariifolium TaxID=118510 RepID=A0A6L2JUA0_TANCI|nr:putative retrotransposon protein [Tanacetum cinerariifolium]